MGELMSKKIPTIIVITSILFFNLFFPVMAAEPTVTSDTSWLSDLVAPSSYFHVRDGNINEITPEDYINRYRRALGLPELRTNEALQASAKNHVDYQNKNGLYNGDPHGENPDAVGFTGATPSDRCIAAGYGSYCGEVQAGGDGDLYSALDGFMMTPFHRLGLIGVGATEVGCAHTGNWVTCDIGYTLYSGYSTDFDFDQPILYPANGQVISTTFPVYETPMPYPDYAGERIGPTLMLWISSMSTPPEAEVALYDLTAQKSIDTIISIDTENWYTLNAVFFNPVEPLELDHEYAAYVHDISGAEAFSEVWTFKTQKSSYVDFPNANETITYDAHVDWAGSGAEQLITTPDPSLSQLIDRLSGYIMLAVDNHGEAWYIDPVSRYRYYLKDGPTAYEFLRSFGLGITNADLAKIPTENDAVGGGITAQRLSGRILLQVEEHGEAWYINPSDLKRYYLANGDEAYRIMREISLGTLMSAISGIEVGEIVLNSD